MNQAQYEDLITPEQRDRLLEVYARVDLGKTWQEFLEGAFRDFTGAVMVHWQGMWLGIEEDGHCHS